MTPRHFDLSRMPTPPRPASIDGDRVRGMLLGLAIGDALGNTSESQQPAARRARHGEIRDYLPNRYADDRAVGLPSDDTQMAMWTVESLLAHGRLDPADLLERFASHRIFGMGQSVRAALERYTEQHLGLDSGIESAGNGAVMRIAPVVLPHLRSPGPALWHDTVAATVITHADELAVVSSLGFVGLLMACLAAAGDALPAPAWWLDTFLAYAQPAEAGRRYAVRHPNLAFEGTLSQFVETHVRPALASTHSTVALCDTWHSGAFLLETMPCVLAILARHGDDPAEAIVRAVNDTRDNDTAAAIVGAAVGALYGASALPERWRSALSGRTGTDDDGRVFELVEAALERFVA